MKRSNSVFARKKIIVQCSDNFVLEPLISGKDESKHCCVIWKLYHFD